MTAKSAEERYLPEHLHEALLADQRVGEQDLQVSCGRALHPCHRDGVDAGPA